MISAKPSGTCTMQRRGSHIVGGKPHGEHVVGFGICPNTLENQDCVLSRCLGQFAWAKCNHFLQVSTRPPPCACDNNRKSSYKQASWSVWPCCVFEVSPVTLERGDKPHRAPLGEPFVLQLQQYLLNRVAPAWCTGEGFT